MALWKPFLGNRSALDSVEKHAGYVYWCADDGSLHFDYTDADGNLQRKQINAKDCETILGMSLEEIKKSISYNDLLNAPTLGALASKNEVAKSDLASDVQESLNKADSAIQEHQSLAGLATEKYVEDKILSIPAPDVSGQINTHNASNTAHADIREQLGQLSAKEAVLYSEQTLTDEQKTQARANIGAVSSWNDLTDRPIVSAGGDTLTWDGNTEGLVSGAIMGLATYKVTDVVPTMADLANGATVTDSDGGSYDIAAEEIIDVTAMGAAVLMVGEVVIALEDNVDAEEIVVPQKGVYFMRDGDWFQASLTIPGYTGFPTETLDPKYLPEHTHSWNELEDKPFGDMPTVIFDDTVTFDEESMGYITLNVEIKNGDSVAVEFDGTVYECVAYETPDGTQVAFGNLSVLGGEDTGEPFAVALMRTHGAILSLNSEVKSASVKFAAITAVKLDRKYITNFIPMYLDMSDDDNTYLYADVDLSRKVTSDELVAACEESPIVLFYAVYGIMQSGCIYPYIISAINGVYYVETILGKHYTAEYTPPTTTGE